MTEAAVVAVAVAVVVAVAVTAAAVAVVEGRTDSFPTALFSSYSGGSIIDGERAQSRHGKDAGWV